MIIKICGLTRAEDALMAQEAGADVLGAIFGVPVSPRNNTFSQLQKIQQEIKDARFAVLLRNANTEETTLINRELKPDVIHFCGLEQEQQWAEVLNAEPDRQLWQTIGVPIDDPKDEQWKHRLDACWGRDEIQQIVLDGSKSGLAGGTGATFPHQRVADHLGPDVKNVMVAGGLTPANVGEVLSIAPWGGVDVSSGVEAEKGIKDHQLIKDFVECARQPQKT
jgi:phosphoribosylanthranilate isomerase